MVIAVEALLLIGVVFFIGYPLFSKKVQEAEVENIDADNFQRLLSKKDLTYSAIKDLEFDYKTGKLSEKDYAELKSQYELEAIKLLEQIDTFKATAGTAKKNAAACPKCNTEYKKNDKFCSSCGWKVQ